MLNCENNGEENFKWKIWTWVIQHQQYDIKTVNGSVSLHFLLFFPSVYVTRTYNRHVQDKQPVGYPIWVINNWHIHIHIIWRIPFSCHSIPCSIMLLFFFSFFYAFGFLLSPLQYLIEVDSCSMMQKFSIDEFFITLGHCRYPLDRLFFIYNSEISIKLTSPSYFFYGFSPFNNMIFVFPV